MLDEGRVVMISRPFSETFEGVYNPAPNWGFYSYFPWTLFA